MNGVGAAQAAVAAPAMPSRSQTPGAIMTQSAEATGIFAQSVGGGGGNGGFAIGAGVSQAEAVTTSVGGFRWIGRSHLDRDGSQYRDGADPDPGRFCRRHSGAVDRRRRRQWRLLGRRRVQHRGAAGRTRGGSGGSGGPAALSLSKRRQCRDTAPFDRHHGAIDRRRWRQWRILRRRNFSGGGAGATNSVGGAAAAPGKGAVIVTNRRGLHSNAGANSIGILAQSIGGGGGNGGFTIGAGGAGLGMPPRPPWAAPGGAGGTPAP